LQKRAQVLATFVESDTQLERVEQRKCK